LIRFIAQAQRTARAIMEPVAGPQYWPFLLQRAGIHDGPLLRLAETVFHGCSAGRGFVYIKPNGEVWPCPFIEVSCGNVRQTPFQTIWATSPVFEDLREREERLQGRCGECSYRRLCGGCRGRAWAISGDYLAEDPSCFIHSSLLPPSNPPHRGEDFLRRGRETLHTVWPAGATVLAGDYLLGQATLLIAELEHARILKVFAQVLCTMCAGEIRRMFVTRKKQSHSRAAVEQTALGSTGGQWGREDYYRSIEAKTASLFASAAEMAGILARAGEVQIAALRRFGRELGMAFQIVDDVLDLTSDETQLGKSAGSDLRQGLITLPILCYLERVEDDTPVNAVLSGQQGGEHVRAAIEAVCSSGAIEASLAEARAHARRSQEALATLPDNDSRRTLCSLAEYVVERRR